MGRKHHKAEEIVAKLRQVEVLTGQGRSIAEAARSIEVSEQAYFRWRAEYGGMKTDQLKRLKELELANMGLTRFGGHPETFTRGAADAEIPTTVFA